MFKFKYLILFISFIQVVPNFLDILQNELDGVVERKCSKPDDKSSYIDTAAECVERNSFLSKEDNGSKCCFYYSKIDPLFDYKRKYGEIGKKLLLKVEVMT